MILVLNVLAIVLQFTQNVYLKKYTSEFRTSEENQHKELLKGSETEPTGSRYATDDEI